MTLTDACGLAVQHASSLSCDSVFLATPARVTQTNELGIVPRDFAVKDAFPEWRTPFEEVEKLGARHMIRVMSIKWIAGKSFDRQGRVAARWRSHERCVAKLELPVSSSRSTSYLSGIRFRSIAFVVEADVRKVFWLYAQGRSVQMYKSDHVSQSTYRITNLFLFMPYPTTVIFCG